MTTKTKNHRCMLCFNFSETVLIDNTFWICLDPKYCISEIAASFDFPPFEEATPDTYKETKALEAQAKRFWEACVVKSRDLKAVLGLDDTTFLTHTKLMNEMTEGDEEC